MDRLFLLLTAILSCILVLPVSTQSDHGNIAGPCLDELNRRQNIQDGVFQPECTSDGFYKPKQCNASEDSCWCVGQCGDAIPGTYGDASIRCEEEPAPCLKHYTNIRSSLFRRGQFRPRCHPDGFYYHTQCLDGECYCTDRCGNRVPGSNHPVSRIRQRICDCQKVDHAYNCPTDPCEGAVCYSYPEAICKPSICGGCKAEFSVDGTVVDCSECIDWDGNQRVNGEEWSMDLCTHCRCTSGLPTCSTQSCAGPPHPRCSAISTEDRCCPEYECPNELEATVCVDRNGVEYPTNAEFEQDCQKCMCSPFGEIFCVDKTCPPSGDDPPSGCYYVTPPGGCCPTRVACNEPYSNCPPGSPIAGCSRNNCLTAICERFPDAICSVSFCGSRACQAFFYDKDGNELDCTAADEVKPRKPSDLRNQPTVNPTTSPTATLYSCPTITCSNACGSSERREVDGCRTCECLDEHMTTELPVCTDEKGTQYPVNAEFERDCQVCTCTPFGEIFCLEKPCPPPRDDPPSGCQYVTPPGGCCATRVACNEPLSSCPPGSPVAMCASNECLTATCERFPDAICFLSFCGRRACQAFFYDKDGKELDCTATDEVKPKVPSDFSTQPPLILTTPPTTCVVVTCPNACGWGGRRVVDGCRTCECVNELPTTTTTPLPTTTAPPRCIDSKGEILAVGSRWKPDACIDCVCTLANVLSCSTILCDAPPPYCVIDAVQDPDTCCPTFTCPKGCIDFSGNPRQIEEAYTEGCRTCICTPFGEPICRALPCAPARDPPPSNCQYVTPPGGCCPTRLACTELETQCDGGPIALCLSNACLDATCEHYPDAKCSISFCGTKACRAVFYDDDDNELNCSVAKPQNCKQETSGMMYKPGDGYNDGCNDCICMEGGIFSCTEKSCGCMDKTSGITYKIGDAFSDGCNDCVCMKDGSFDCTRKYCMKASKTSDGPMCDPWVVQSNSIWSSRPRCKPDGTYSSKQCCDDGTCWCVDYMGDMIEGSLLVDGKLLECDTEPPCQMELDLNQQKVDCGEPLTSDPICDKEGYYEPEQCDPNTNLCWCSERDGTMVLASQKTRGEDLRCSKVCFGKDPLLSTKCSYHTGCPRGRVCHMERCCRVLESRRLTDIIGGNSLREVILP